MIADDHFTADDIGKALEGKRNNATGTRSCRCPAHEDKSPSLSVSPGNDVDVVLHCHKGCDPEAVIDALRRRGLWHDADDTESAEDIIRRMGERAKRGAQSAEPASFGPWKWVEPPYCYTDADGALVFQVRRKERFDAAGNKQKDFRQRHLGPNGEWINTQGPRRVLYRGPDLHAHPDATVFVCEGEKDADRLASMGLCATTVANGNWADVDVSCISGRDVIILEDADIPGITKAAKAAEVLGPLAKTLRVVRLPGHEHTAEKHGKDVSDWLDEDPANAERFVEVCFDVPPKSALDGLRAVDMSDWDSAPTPERLWAVTDRIPLRQVYLHTGNGGTGKSLAELQRCVAHVLGRDWLGMPVRQGPAIYLSGEDDKDELHIRLAAIAAHYGTTFAELQRAGLHLLDYAGENCILGTPDKSGIIQPTELFKMLEAAALKIKPVAVVIDTVADTYAGNEIDRQQVTQFLKMGQRLAQRANCSVGFIAHPSVAGMASGSGISGSTGWHNKVRARAYMTTVEEDEDLREIKFMKNNYGRQGDSIIVRWQGGVFVREDAADNDLKKRAQNRRVDLRFLDLLARYEQQGRTLSDRPNSPSNYAPKVFAAETDGEKFSAGLYRDAMGRLFSNNEIHIAEWGPPSKRVRFIARGARQS